jgi:hypothetical protein
MARYNSNATRGTEFGYLLNHITILPNHIIYI